MGVLFLGYVFSQYFWRVGWLCIACLPGLLSWCALRECLPVLEAGIQNEVVEIFETHTWAQRMRDHPRFPATEQEVRAQLVGGDWVLGRRKGMGLPSAYLFTWEEQPLG